MGKTCRKSGTKSGKRLKRKGVKKDDYEQVINGEPFVIEFGEKWKHKCCKCGLIHDIKVEKITKTEYAITF
jgi:hypothetical protein